MTVIKQWNGSAWAAVLIGEQGAPGIYVGDTPPEDPDIELWADTTAQGTGIIPSIDVSNYGTVGDGVADDTAAISLAIDDLETAAAVNPGAVLTFPPGTYKISRLTIDASNFTMLGYGATLLSTNGPAGGQSSVLIRGSNVRVYGLTLDHTLYPPLDEYPKMDFAHGLRLEGATGHSVVRGNFCRVRDVTVRGAWFSGIVGIYYRSINVDACTVESVSATGIFLNSNDEVSVTNNTVKGSGDDGIFVGANANSTYPGYTRARRLTITGNHVADTSAKGIGVSGAYGATISHNQIENTHGVGIRCFENDTDGYGPSSNITIANNTLTDIGQYLGWQGVLESTCYGLHLASGSWKLNIIGNIIENCHADGLYMAGQNATGGPKNGRVSIIGNTIDGSDTGNGMQIGQNSHPDHFACYDLIITGNRISNVNANGIGVNCSTYIMINNNLIRTWGKSETGTRRAINLDSCDIAMISDNLYVNDAVSASTKGGTNLISTTAVRLSNNWFYPDQGTQAGTAISMGGRLIISGGNTPEGAITAEIGSLYMRTNGAANTCLYVKESGTGNTGWVAK